MDRYDRATGEAEEITVGVIAGANKGRPQPILGEAGGEYFLVTIHITKTPCNEDECSGHQAERCDVPA